MPETDCTLDKAEDSGKYSLSDSKVFALMVGMCEYKRQQSVEETPDIARKCWDCGKRHKPVKSGGSCDFCQDTSKLCAELSRGHRRNKKEHSKVNKNEEAHGIHSVEGAGSAHPLSLGGPGRVLKIQLLCPFRALHRDGVQEGISSF
jgi:hypothetical protein